MDRMISDDEVMEIGKKLKKLREKHNLTQQEFANELFWDVSSYQKIESGRVLITADKAIQIHKKYGVGLDYFLADDSDGEEDAFMQSLVNGSKEKSTKMMIRMLEYFIQFLKCSLK